MEQSRRDRDLRERVHIRERAARYDHLRDHLLEAAKRHGRPRNGDQI